MRSDAARNLDAVLQTGAVVLARDPGASMAAIAEQAGVDRSTVYRRFANRDALRSAIHQAKFDAAERVFDDARLLEAPVPVALHRYVEGIIGVSRQWPVDFQMLHADPEAEERSERLLARLEAFMARAVREGVLRADLPAGWAVAALRAMTDIPAHRLVDLPAGPAADLVVESLLAGLGPARA
jgi:AcrR family transcriptional regulator